MPRGPWVRPTSANFTIEACDAVIVRLEQMRSVAIEA